MKPRYRIVSVVLLALLGAASPGWGQTSEGPEAVATRLRARALRLQLRGGAPEQIAGALARSAMLDPAAPQTWAALSRTLQAFRPPTRPNRAAPAERLALWMADSMAVRTGALTALRLRPVRGRTHVVLETTRPVKYTVGDLRRDPERPRIYLDLQGVRSALPANTFTGLDRGGVRALRTGKHASGAVRVVVDLAGQPDYRVEQEGNRIIVSLANPAGPFTAWSSRPAWGPVVGAVERVIPPVGTLVSAVPALQRSAVPGASGASDGPDAVEQFRRGLEGIAARAPAVNWPAVGTGLVVATGIIVTLLGLLRWRARRPAAAPEPEASRASAARVWAARSLAAGGASPTEIVQKTGLAQDAVVMLARRTVEADGADRSSGSGTIFRPSVEGQRRTRRRRVAVTA